jgi:iron(III) transport system substrate-binding protein
VRDLVAAGEYHCGFTDTDAAHGAVEDGLSAAWLIPDQEEGGLGTLVIPNTASLVAGGPNPEGGKALIDYLLSAEVEEGLANTRSLQIPLNPAVPAPARVPKLKDVKAMAVDYEAMADMMTVAADFIRKEFRP